MITDLLGNIPKVGDKVLFKPPSSFKLEGKGIIKQINKVTVTIKYLAHKYTISSNEYVSITYKKDLPLENHGYHYKVINGAWNITDKDTIATIRRETCDFIVISDSIYNEMLKNQNEFIQKHPEIMI